MEEEKIKRLNCEEDEDEDEGIDRLSHLGDNLLHHIFSFLDTKYAVRTSALSKRWRFLWASSPYINFDRASFNDLTSFKNFVLTVLQHRHHDAKIARFCLTKRNSVDESLLNQVIDYALSNNANHLSILDPYDRRYPAGSHVSCKTFYLTESSSSSSCFTALTTLHLEHIYFYDVGNRTECFDFFLTCPNLINLSLIHCGFSSFEVFKILGPHLLNLTMEYAVCSKLEISAPKLTFFKFHADCYLDLSAINLPSLEHADIDTCMPYIPPDIEIYRASLPILLQGIRNAQYIILNPEIIKALTYFSDLLENQPSPFSRLKSLKLKVNYYDADEPLKIPVKVMTYFHNASPSAETMLIDFPELHMFQRNYIRNNFGI